MVRNPKAAKEPPADAVYISASQVLRRYGNVSALWLETRLRDDPDFPRPITFTDKRGWRYFSVKQLEAYERKRAEMSA